MAAYFPGNCTYRYSMNWGTSYPYGWYANGNIASLSADTSATCNGVSSTCSATNATRLCESNNSTPYRTTDGTWYIFHKWVNAPPPSPSTTNYTWTVSSAVITNSQGNNLALTCSSFAGGWTSISLPHTRTVSASTCYLLQIRCTHPYLNNIIHGTSRKPWTNTCQPCY